MYVHHAQNIVEGRPYAETGYIYNPAVPVYGPRMYPPVFPLLLTPLYKLFGPSLVPMKLEQVAFFVLILGAVYGLWTRDLPPVHAIALVAILGFSPTFWDAKDSALSDLPFLLFFYVSALLVRKAPHDQRGWWRWAVVTGLVLYLAMGTRSAGIALIAGLVLYSLLRYRTLTKLTVVALAVCGALVLLQTRLVGSGVGSYIGQSIHPSPHAVRTNLMAYTRAVGAFWVASAHNPLSYSLLAVVALLMIAGLFYQYKRGFTIVEAFLAPYLCVILLWPFPAGIRIMFPFIPWMVFLALTGLSCLTEHVFPRYSTAATCGLLMLIAVPYVSAYHKTDFGPIRQSDGLPEFNQLCEAVRDHTRPRDVFICFRPRALSLYTSRAASTYDYHGTEQEFWQYASSIRAAYVITNTFNDDDGFLVRCVGKYTSRLELAYQNPNFTMYRIRTVAEARIPASDR